MFHSPDMIRKRDPAKVEFNIQADRITDIRLTGPATSVFEGSIAAKTAALPEGPRANPRRPPNRT